MNAVDTILSKQIAVAQMLATSPALQTDDFVAFRQEAERATHGLSGGWIVLADQDGQEIMNLLPGTHDPLPKRMPTAIALQRRALATGQFQVSGVLESAVKKTPVVTVEVPVMRKDKPPLAIAVIMEPGIFLTLFEQWNLPEGWLAGLIDRNGNFIARSHNHEDNVGRPASEGFRAAAANASEGWNEMVSLEGGTIANAHVTSMLSGWVMGLATDKALFEAPIRKTILIAGLAGGATTLLSLLLAIWSARRIARPIEQIEQGTHALGLRRTMTFTNTGLPEADRTLDVIASTAKVLEQHDKERDEREGSCRTARRTCSPSCSRSRGRPRVIRHRSTSSRTASIRASRRWRMRTISWSSNSGAAPISTTWSTRSSPPSAPKRLLVVACASCSRPRRCKTWHWRCMSLPPTLRNTARCRCRRARSTSIGQGSRARATSWT
jgi:hypothetical protein